jgi:hypothetical protein
MNSIDEEQHNGGCRSPPRLTRSKNHRLPKPKQTQQAAGALAPGDSSREQEAIADWLLCWDESYIIPGEIGNFFMDSLSLLG